MKRVDPIGRVCEPGRSPTEADREDRFNGVVAGSRPAILRDRPAAAMMHASLGNQCPAMMFRLRRRVFGPRHLIPLPMDTPGPDWKLPPVIEVVLAVRFEELEALTNGHLGRFWGLMQADFPYSDDVPPIPTLPEGYGDEFSTGFPVLDLRHTAGESRLRMMNADRTKMIQVQNGWLIANWVKKDDSHYPGFEGVKALFDRAYNAFDSFMRDSELGSIKPMLWEVTYVDHVPRDTVWDSLADLPKVFPGLFGHGRSSYGTNELVDSTWGWSLPEQRGHLQVSVQSVRGGLDSRQEILLVRSTARGNFRANNKFSLDEALKFGRSSVVGTFLDLASEEAKRYWKGG
jgi:uncharacterized protein (TIGR04255 family)